MTGYRLRPDIAIRFEHIREAGVQDRDINALIEELGRKAGDITEAVDALSHPGSTVVGIARQLGVSSRTLQRQFRNMALPAPDFWRMLGRARHTANALPGGVPLTQIAYEFGYSDQAHMTRDFRRWFGINPSTLRRDALARALISEPGLGNWDQDRDSKVTSVL